MLFTQTNNKWLLGMLFGVSVLMPALGAEDSSNPTDSCLKAWGKHPFGKNPEYKTLATSVKVFGIGGDTADIEPTAKAALVLINPGVNVAGGSVVQLMNPNGWYCFRTSVNVLGGLTIKAHCKAHLATTAGEVVSSSDDSKKGVTVLGSTQVERVGCD
jgi:hypothetical protein